MSKAPPPGQVVNDKEDGEFILSQKRSKRRKESKAITRRKKLRAVCNAFRCIVAGLAILIFIFWFIYAVSPPPLPEENKSYLISFAKWFFASGKAFPAYLSVLALIFTIFNTFVAYHDTKLEQNNRVTITWEDFIIAIDDICVAINKMKIVDPDDPKNTDKFKPDIILTTCLRGTYVANFVQYNLLIDIPVLTCRAMMKKDFDELSQATERRGYQRRRNILFKEDVYAEGYVLYNTPRRKYLFPKSFEKCLDYIHEHKKNNSGMRKPRILIVEDWINTGISVNKLLRQIIACGSADPSNGKSSKPWKYENEDVHQYIKVVTLVERPHHPEPHERVSDYCWRETQNPFYYFPWGKTD
ncbi:MAG: hypothetical protein LBQ91_05965 [Oscillospiraceae bacterium]|jgi:hypothetical protein|nr:hypothetical protein [Oscillospiraceae bacterium]